MTVATKPCEFCANDLQKRPKDGVKKWASRRFCSAACRYESARQNGGGGLFQKGHEVPAPWRRAVGEHHRGNTYRRGARHTEAAKEKNRRAKLGKMPWNKGRPHLCGPRHPNWKGGISARDHKSLKYREWREAVYARDGYACVNCGGGGGRLEAHHIRRWADRPDLRYAISNGITLCRPCHGLIRKYEDDYAPYFEEVIASAEAPVCR